MNESDKKLLKNFILFIIFSGILIYIFSLSGESCRREGVCFLGWIIYVPGEILFGILGIIYFSKVVVGIFNTLRKSGENKPTELNPLARVQNKKVKRWLYIILFTSIIFILILYFLIIMPS